MDLKKISDEQLQQQIKALQAEEERRKEEHLQGYASQVEAVLSGLDECEKDAVLNRLGYKPDQEKRRLKEIMALRSHSIPWAP